MRGYTKIWKILLWVYIIVKYFFRQRRNHGWESAYRPGSWRPAVLPLYLQQTQDQHNWQIFFHAYLSYHFTKKNCTHSFNRTICHIFLASIATYQQQTQDQHNFLRNICSIFSQTYLENILRQKKKKYHPTFTNKDKRLTHIKNT